MCWQYWCALPWDISCMDLDCLLRYLIISIWTLVPFVKCMLMYVQSCKVKWEVSMYWYSLLKFVTRCAPISPLRALELEDEHLDFWTIKSIWAKMNCYRRLQKSSTFAIVAASWCIYRCNRSWLLTTYIAFTNACRVIWWCMQLIDPAVDYILQATSLVWF